MTEGQVLACAIDLVETIASGGVIGGDPLRPGKDILARVSARLHDQLQLYLFGSGVRLQTEQQAMAYVRSIGVDLTRGSEALLQAAEHLKAAGRLHPANETYRAHKALQAKAHEVLGG